ncbi:hypothetical protein GCM10010174_69210 [Kutzneria viridogrisea]|uniref:Uncharacterized protein n=1 Tax=Kutzneria viridogrisea TaxID=47990 RepID=A0ABR6BB28_9PSEU|nr:hypothetical protein [Kutzneria viridogrisea]
MSGHPAELTGLDLHEVWTGAPPLGDRFDPFSFPQRMAAYRALIQATNHNGLFGADNRDNPLWGLMFQHQWQHRTGRLGLGDRIDPDAGWGFGNYALCVIPWLGAVAAGVVPPAELLEPPGPTRFRYGPEQFDTGLADWRRYFELVRATRPGSDLEPLRLALWKAHKSCLDVVAGQIATTEPDPYSPTELLFLRGWCRMVDYLWAAAWRTDFDFMVEYGLDVLPEHPLRAESDLAALPTRARRNVRNVLRLARTPDWRYALNLLLWRRVMRTRQARDEVLAMLEAVFQPSTGTKAARRRLIGYLLRP